MTPTPPADDRAASLRDLVGTGRFADALRTFRENDGPGLRRQPELLLLAATAATRLGDLEAARPLADAALAGFRARGDRDGRMRALNLLGVIGFEQGRLDDAEEAFRGALALARELGDSLLAARASNNLAS
ncbi:MAG: tetratricopeptide repeat protein, partial [Gemmatimonadota bacterium]